MNKFKSAKNKFDRIVDFVALTFVLTMSLIVAAQVFTRNVFSYTPRWSEEVSILLLVWITFLGIAVGFREKLHIGVGVFVGMMPKKIQSICDLIAKIIIIVVSIVFIVYGYQFTVLMGNSTMAGTGFPTSVLYAAIPIGGILMLIYGIELLFKDGIHQEWDENLGE